jgi:hypothetical protein
MYSLFKQQQQEEEEVKKRKVISNSSLIMFVENQANTKVQNKAPKGLVSLISCVSLIYVLP